MKKHPCRPGYMKKTADKEVCRIHDFGSFGCSFVRYKSGTAVVGRTAVPEILCLIELLSVVVAPGLPDNQDRCQQHSGAHRGPYPDLGTVPAAGE